jgi:hypothetical protein
MERCAERLRLADAVVNAIAHVSEVRKNGRHAIALSSQRLMSVINGSCFWNLKRPGVWPNVPLKAAMNALTLEYPVQLYR